MKNKIIKNKESLTTIYENTIVKLTKDSITIQVK